MGVMRHVVMRHEVVRFINWKINTHGTFLHKMIFLNRGIVPAIPWSRMCVATVTVPFPTCAVWLTVPFSGRSGLENQNFRNVPAKMAAITASTTNLTLR